MEKQLKGENTDLIIGRNAISEALRSGRSIDTLLVIRGERNGSVGRIIAECKEKGIVVKEVDKKKLDFMCPKGNHQGVVAWAAVHEYSTVEDIFALAEERGEDPFIIICDELEDPHNLGAIIRTAETSGAHGVIIPKRRNASLSWAVGKSSAGAVEYVPVARVGNLASTVEELGLIAEVLHTRAEEAGQSKEYREKFDIVCSRAVAALNVLCEYCLPFVKVGGVFLAMKAAKVQEEIADAKNAIKTLGGKIVAEKSFTLSDGGERTIVVIKKISQVPPKYPRPSAQIAKKPL